jgi:hypothetical protein
MQTVNDHPTGTKAPPTPPRSMHEICESVRLADCGECWPGTGTACATNTVPPAQGYHVARFGRAVRRGPDHWR